ncbi:DNA-binding protein [Streptomyces sp. H27-H5]|uniref:DNA-binding protein n=1 Tax=Streptomyces sp. H27-H5 TaxID=2996460 RepID=UPI00226E5E85|nr:DNA-binding protein [Streptomyces sp. H27-H5]MCY0961792.1 DNA-binding protein [Streptomyces sp. H27-H5]
MIPRGRPTLDIHEVAARAGVSVATWRRRHHQAFAAAVQPLPGSVRPLIYDAAQVDAHLAGEPLPPLPSGPHPGDLLTDSEAGAIAGVTASTVRADAVNGLMDRGTERHGRRWWTRAAAEARAGREAQYKGRTAGAKDLAPRIARTDPRIREVAAIAEAAEAGQAQPVTAAQLAERYGVSTRTAERLMAKADEARRTS